MKGCILDTIYIHIKYICNEYFESLIDLELEAYHKPFSRKVRKNFFLNNLTLLLSIVYYLGQFSSFIIMKRHREL